MTASSRGRLTPGARRVLRDASIDVGRTLAPLVHGSVDPTARFAAPGEVWRATRTPAGPASQRIRRLRGAIEVEAWGQGAEWATERAVLLLGLHDDPTSFTPRHPLLADLHRRNKGLRICRSDVVTETLVPVVIQQKVQTVLARKSYARLTRMLKDPAPGPFGLLLPPDPARVAALPYYEMHRLGIERRRAEVLRVACSYSRRLEEATSMPRPAAAARLRALPGVGAWTTAYTAAIALGDPDAVPVGDFHLPHTVAWVLAGEARGSDERMLELLEPYRGHRWRAVRLIKSSGLRAPAFGPRLPFVSYESY